MARSQHLSRGVELPKKLRNRYFALRHGESKANVAGVILSNPKDGVVSFGLSRRGKKQVRDSVSQNDVLDSNVVIYSSDFLRARETAEIAKNLLDARKVNLHKNLRERYFGGFDETDLKNLKVVWRNDKINADNKHNGVESPNEVLRRTIRLINGLEKKHKNKTILLVSHGDVLQILQTGLRRKSASEHGKIPYPKLAEIRELKLGPRRRRNLKGGSTMFDPKESRTVGYHLFFLPEGELFDGLQSTINALADKYGGAKFEPHLTLLARIPKADEAELIAKAQQLATTMSPFEVKPKEVRAEDAYFRALYCEAEPNPTMEEYHQKALEAFGVQDVNVYMPRLSLYYGNVPQSTKDEMIASLQLPASMKFLVDKVYLYRTEGEAQDWVRVGEYPLGK